MDIRNVQISQENEKGYRYKMKIVHVCLCGCVTDGWSYQDNLLPKYQKRIGNDVTVIASKWIWNSEGKMEICHEEQYVNQDGVKMIRLNALFHAGVEAKLKIYPGLIRTIEKETPNILFVHDLSFLQVNTICNYLKKHRNITAYCDNHGDFSNSARNWLSRNLLHKGIWKIGAQRINKYVKKFYGVLPARVDFLKEMYDLPEKKCGLLIMAADDDLVEYAGQKEVVGKTKKKYQIDEKDFVIVTGGKIDLFKQQTLMLMKAVNQMLDINIKLFVFGSVVEELKGKLYQLCSERVKYVSWLNNKEAYELFAIADIAIFPGRHSVYWEQAVGQGIPMIVKRWEGTEHVDLGGNVLFLDEDSVEEIKKKMAEAYGNLENMKAVARKNSRSFLYSSVARESIK